MRPPLARTEQRGTRGEQGGAGIGLGMVEQQAAAMVAVSLPRRPGPHVERGGEGIDHRADALPDLAAQGALRSLAFGCRREKQLEHEDMIVARQFPVQTALKRLQTGLAAEYRGGLLPPACGLGEIGKGAAGRELAGGLGNDVVVRRRAVAAQAGKVFLMVMQLTQEVRVVLEQCRGGRPAGEQSSNPDPRQEPDPELDPAGPVDAGQKGIAPPPGSKLPGREVGITIVRREKVGGGKDRQLVVPRRLPDVLDGADLSDVATVDVEGVGSVGRAPTRSRVEEPVGIQ